MRRLPVYILLDTSGSMRGEPIEAVKVGLGSLVSTLRQDPSALESVYLSILTFDREAKVIAPLTSLEDFQIPDLETTSGPTHTGLALKELCDCVDRDIIKSTGEQKGDWKPLMFLMTDGSPSDLQVYNEQVPRVRGKDFGIVVACAAGPKAKSEILEKLADHVVSLDTMDGNTFSAFFQWVSASVASGNMSMGATNELTLPPPPEEINMVL